MYEYTKLTGEVAQMLNYTNSCIIEWVVVNNLYRNNDGFLTNRHLLNMAVILLSKLVETGLFNGVKR